MPASPILYLGDTALHSAAGYLAGLMTHWGFEYDYVPSDAPATPELIAAPRRLFILSDYPAARMTAPVQQTLVEQVRRGAGLLMIGGWESFQGDGGNWAGTPLAGALPVEISSEDDRINCDQPAMVIRRQDHPILDSLPWDERPPAIGGFNRLRPRPGAEVLLEVERFTARQQGGQTQFTPRDRHPLLIVSNPQGPNKAVSSPPPSLSGRGRGRVEPSSPILPPSQRGPGQASGPPPQNSPPFQGGAGGALHVTGRTAALATDVAPHWVGGLVDWGDQRVTARAPNSDPVEVGNLYARFFHQLLQWTAGYEP